MCGLVGLMQLDGDPISGRILQTMTDRVAHRGPDGEGIWVGRGVGLGHRRLAIIAPGPEGRQPMATADGRYVISYNGEVYNFAELRVELEALGRVFRTRTDTEVVLQACAHWGPAAVERFNGMFAFALWDTVERTLLLARDRYGIKPLYYTERGRLLLFGSEVKALLARPAMTVDVCLPALHEYFTFQNIFSDRTLFDGVRMLPAGHTLRLPVGAPGVPPPRQYWDFNFAIDRTLDLATAEEEVARLFEQAVDRQLVADTAIGTYLSGGIDSGSITCVAARRLPGLFSYTCGFDLSSASGLEMACDERAKAEQLANLYKTEHYEIVLKAGDMERAIERLTWHLEDPRVGQSYPNFYAARLASHFSKVVLSGTGSDELFAGYPWRYYGPANNNADPDDYLDKYYAYWQRLVPDELKPSFFRPHLHAATLGAHPTRQVFKGVHAARLAEARTPEEYVNFSLYFELRTFMHGLLVVEDKLSMAHGLETRVPFLDNDLVEFAMRIPVHLKLRNLTPPARLDENLIGRKSDHYFRTTNDGKLILREVLSRFVPREYAFAPKQGFSAPDGSWFKGESVDYLRRLFSADARIFEYLERDTVRALLADHFAGRQNRRLLIWSFLSFEWWLRVFMPA
ncbi:MAG: asparagine synthase (glutamine-hydrolyzing) [Myxococcales bacterium]|nr:asparagine synthase (glutamine-hydrolyzing) [Myxococcales bacterium]